MSPLKCFTPFSFVFNEVLICSLLSVCFNFFPYVSEAFENESAKYSKCNEPADDKNLGGVINSFVMFLKCNLILKNERHGLKSVKKFNKVTQVGRDENITFNWAKSSFSNTAK